MQVDFEHVSLDDKVPERNNDYIFDRANLRHKFSWGKGSILSQLARLLQPDGVQRI